MTGGVWTRAHGTHSPLTSVLLRQLDRCGQTLVLVTAETAALVLNRPFGRRRNNRSRPTIDPRLERGTNDVVARPVQAPAPHALGPPAARRSSLAKVREV